MLGGMARTTPSASRFSGVGVVGVVSSSGHMGSVSLLHNPADVALSVSRMQSATTGNVVADWVPITGGMPRLVMRSR
jgi:hypothetical protein